jgi:lipopolysaccharide transport system ATP-binding protein
VAFFQKMPPSILFSNKMKPIIEVQNLSKQYRIGSRQRYLSLRDSLMNFGKKLKTQNSKLETDSFWALDDVSFDIQVGESVGIIGRNGAGKSTLLKILSRITPPTKGRAILRGRLASLLEVGTGFHPELTGRENVFMNGSILGLKRTEIAQKFDEIVAFSGVEQFIDTPLKNYSSGMQLRLAFAVAAHLEPEILIIDEVLAVGDNFFQQKCLEKMRQIRQTQNRTIVFVSHNLTAVEQLCSRAILLDKGNVLMDGTVLNVIERYNQDVILRGQFFDLKNTPRHSYQHDIIFSEVVFDKGSYQFGDTIALEFEIQRHTDAHFEDLEFGIAFDDIRNNRLLHLSNIFLPKKFTFPTNKQTLRFHCATQTHNLRPGDYRLTFFLRADNVIQDFLQEIIAVHISESPLPYGFTNLSMIQSSIFSHFDFQLIP